LVADNKASFGSPFLWPGMAGMPEMQEQFPARAWMARHCENGASTTQLIAEMPETQQHFPAAIAADQLSPVYFLRRNITHVTILQRIRRRQ
jgi:hypothetical protein